MKITQKIWNDAARATPTYSTFADICNKAIEIAQAEAEQSEYITAEQARALGAGKAEWRNSLGEWRVCGDDDFRPINIKGDAIPYRAIKQPKPADPHTELKALYAQQVADGTVDLVRWDYLHTGTNGQWLECGVPPNWNPTTKYSCIDLPTCQVQLIGGEVQTMTREAAKVLQAETKATHDWAIDGFWGKNTVNYDFNEVDTLYAYRPKAKKVISWSSLPVGVMTLHGELRSVDKAGKNANIEILEEGFNDVFIQPIETRNLTLAPASEQKWLAVQDCFNFPRVPGVAYKFDMGRVKVIGIESGYVLGGGV